MRATVPSLLLALAGLAAAPALARPRATPAPAAPAVPVVTAPASPWLGGAPPRLTMIVVVDQLRADYLSRFGDALLPATQPDGRPGGFRWLLEHGAYYPYGDHDVIQAMTGPGHATVSTGAWPARNGVPLNAWHDAARGADVYCVDDPDAPIVGGGGRPVSSRVLTSTAIGDELKLANPASQVVSVALKDRAAILLGGQRPDMALWFDPGVARWVTSRRYAPSGALPGWMDRLSDGLSPAGTRWTWEVTGEGTGRSAHGRTRGFTDTLVTYEKSLLASPYGLDLTVDAAAAALDAYALGADGVPDLLAVSFSSFDFLGHAQGPNSREMEAMFVATDRALAELLEQVGRRVPIDQVVIALTGDHGAPPLADWSAGQGRDAGRIASSVLVKRAEDALVARFGKPAGGAWIAADEDFNLWLAPAALSALPAGSRVAVEDVVRDALMAIPGVLTAFTATDVRLGRLPPGDLARRVGHQYIAGRSGDVVAIPRPGWYSEDDPVSHMTGWSYDRLVPIMIAGPGVRPGLRTESAEVVDIAPTLAFLLGTMPPAAAEGRVLSESLRE